MKIMVARRTTLWLGVRLCSFAYLAGVLFFPISAAALSPEQIQAIQSGARYVNTEETPDAPTTCGGNSLTGSDNAHKVWNFLVGKGLQPEQAAGVMGNFAVESGFDPFNQENSKAWDSGGWGIAQWTAGRRDTIKASVITSLGADFYIPTEEAGSKIGTADEDRLLQHQLEFMYNESNQRTMRNDSGTKEWTGLQATASVEEAAVFWLENFERAGIPHLNDRLGEANKYLILYGSGTSGIVQPPTGSNGCSLDSSSCPTDTVTEDQLVNVQGIRVHGCVSAEVDRIVTLARAQGLDLTGGGWRSAEGQIELRRAHCGTSQYDIYEKPSSSCSPPTARPGNSNHERGTAIDFSCNGSAIGSKSHPCFRFLLDNTSLINLDSEPWHWSVDGS